MLNFTFFCLICSYAVLLSYFPVIFRVYDSDGNGKVAFNDMLEVLQDLTGPFISEVQREVVFVCYTPNFFFL